MLESFAPATPARKSFRQSLSRLGISIRQHKSEADRVQEFAAATVAGLNNKPRSLECRFLYDARGSELFESITRQPEYYLTRTETAILAEQAWTIREICGATTLVELGSGNSEKTDHLLRAWLGQGQRVRYIPVDVSDAALLQASQTIAGRHPETEIVTVNSDYCGAFPLLRQTSPVTVLFLGSSIGNFPPEAMDAFLQNLSQALSPDDYFLLGIDLVKDVGIIEAAYNDRAGVTQEFTRNLFHRMNRELGSSINPLLIDHVAVYDERREQVEISARFRRRQVIRVAPYGKEFVIDEGEAIDTEISRKFRLAGFLPYVKRFGLTPEAVFTDHRQWFALLLLRKTKFPSRLSRTRES